MKKIKFLLKFIYLYFTKGSDGGWKYYFVAVVNENNMKSFVFTKINIGGMIIDEPQLFTTKEHAKLAAEYFTKLNEEKRFKVYSCIVVPMKIE